MATLTIAEAMQAIPNYLNRVTDEAKRFMAQYIRENAKEGYATGTLANSISKFEISANEIAVGTRLESKSGRVYGAFVDKGRPAITKNKGAMHYFDTKYGVEVWTKHVREQKGIGFIDATLDHMRSTHIGLK